MPDEEFKLLRLALLLNPEQGKVIPGSGGLRKLRWAGHGRGNSGGFRVIYYYIKESDLIFLLAIYPKSEQTDLSKAQLNLLRQVVQAEFK